MTPLILGLHLLSWHDHDQGCEPHPPCAVYRTQTPGIYATLPNGATFGALRNSYDRWSAYAGWTWRADPFAVTFGAITGYPQATVRPLLVPSVKFGPVRLAAYPKTRNGGAFVVHLAIEKEFEQ